MLLRPRQEEFVSACSSALDGHGNTLGVAPTGAGKTVMLSALVGRRLLGGQRRAIILQHRDELTRQNRGTFYQVNPDLGRSGVIDANSKDLNPAVVFAMVPTLARNLDLLQKGRPFDIAIFDEAHHVAAKSYVDIIKALREANQKIEIAGFTATPQRGDRKSLRSIFDNVGDQIMIAELIKTGVLVRPRTFVVDIGVQEDLRNIRSTVVDFDMSEVAKIMDHTPLNSRVVREWQEKAGDRQTVVFCSTVEHAEHVRDAFTAEGINARMVHGGIPKGERKRILSDFDRGAFQVLVNVNVLTEGWDCQPVGCVVLLRPSSYKSTMIQMIGRGLRRLEPERYPGRVKTDCIIMDFGTSVLTHGSLEQDIHLEPPRKPGEGMKKKCPECLSQVPAAAHECGICGYEFPIEEAGGEAGAASDGKPFDDFVLTEIDLFNQSPFKWEELWNGQVLIANGFEAWGMAVFFNGYWHAIGGARGVGVHHLSVGDKMVCISTADDFLRSHESDRAASKSRRWLHEPISDKQDSLLRLPQQEAMALTRYTASCLLTWKFNERAVRACLQRAQHGIAA